MHGQWPWRCLLRSHSFSKISVNPCRLNYSYERSYTFTDHLGMHEGMAANRANTCTPCLPTVRYSTDQESRADEADKKVANRSPHDESVVDFTLPDERGNRDDIIIKRRTSDFLRKVAAGRTALPKDLLRKVSHVIANCPRLAVDLNVRINFKHMCMIYEQTRSVCVSSSSHASQHINVGCRPPKASPKRNYQHKKAAGASQKPNYFVAVPVLDPIIRNNIDLVQQSIVQHNAALQPALIDLATLHLTVMVLRLADSDIHRAKTALNDCQKELYKCSYSCPVLDVSGIGNFNQSVIFAKVAPNAGLDSLNKIVDTVKNCFANHGLFSTDSRGFQPHITVLKLSKMRRSGIVDAVDPSSYADHVDRFMGRQSVTRLQLCAMELPKDRQTGYYHVAHEVHLN